EFLHENPNETPTTAARLFHLKKEDSVRKAWLRAKRKGPEPKKKGGQNKILRPDQHQAMIRYAVDQATNGGKGATKQMMYNCAMWPRVQEDKAVPTWRWFQLHHHHHDQSCPSILSLKMRILLVLDSGPLIYI